MKMKKFVTLMVIMILSINLNAQDFEKGGNYVCVGYGLDPWGNPGNGFAFDNSNYRKTTIGPSLLMYERGITDILGIGRIGVGGGFAHSLYSEKWVSAGAEYKNVSHRISVILRAAYHFEFDIPKMDVYAGVGTAFHAYINSSSTFPLGHYVFAGIRYYLTDAIGVYAEAGHGLAALNGGLVFKF